MSLAPAASVYRDAMFSRYTRDRLATASLLLNHVIAIAEAKSDDELVEAVAALQLARPNEHLSDALYAVEDVCTRWDMNGATEIRL